MPGLLTVHIHVATTQWRIYPSSVTVNGSTVPQDPLMWIEPLDSTLFLVIVFRFWVEVGHKNRLFFLLDNQKASLEERNGQCGHSIAKDCALSLCRRNTIHVWDIQELELLQTSRVKRDYSRTNNAPAVGHLDDEENTPYVVYRILLFTDRFKMFSRKVASGVGVLEERNLADAVCILGMPPRLFGRSSDTSLDL